MRFGRVRVNMRGTALSAAAFALLISLLIVWLGYRHDVQMDRLVTEGELAQGEYFSTEKISEERPGRKSEEIYEQINVRYEVNGVEYLVAVIVAKPGRAAPLFDPETIRLPRLGEEKAFQVVYLPTDPSVARLRYDIKKYDVAFYAAAGLFMFVGFVFGVMGLFILRKS